MKKEIWIYSQSKNKWIKPSKFGLFWFRLKKKFTKWKFVDTSKYSLIPWEDKKRQFTLSDKEYKESERLYKEKGTISYEFYPCGGIGWGVKIHVLETNEIIDITDVSNW